LVLGGFMQIKKYLTELWNKIKYDESGQLKIGRVSPYIHAINALRSPQKYKEYMLGQAVTKQETRLTTPTTKTTPKQMFVNKVPYPTSELTPSRESYYKPTVRTPSQSIFRNLPEAPKVTPLVTGKAEPPSAADTKVLAYLKEYVGQMRAAGFPDYFIRKKLIATKSIFIPDKLPANFGQTGPWATGMADEFKEAMQKYKNEQGLLSEDVMLNFVPSPDEYLNFMPGNVANRLPSYSEYTGQETSPYYSPSGKFSQTKMENLSKALANYMTTYQGSTVSPSQYTYEAGIAGLPQGLGQQYYQEFLALAEQKAGEVGAQEEYEDLVMKYPEVQFTPGASVEENAAKIAQYNELTGGQKPELSDVALLLNDAVYQATMAGEPINMEDVMNAALMLNIKLTYDEAMAIFNSAKDQALRDMGQ